MIEWSFDLLDENSRNTLIRLSVFSGSFKEELVVPLCVGDGREEIDVLDCIDELIDSSLMSRDSEDPERYRILFTIQAFGREMLNESGVLADVEKRHGEVLAAYSQGLSEQFLTEKEAEVAAAIHAELPNLRSAFERALASDLQLAASLTVPLFLFSFHHRGAESAEWFARIAAHPDVDSLAQAPIIFAGASNHAFHSGGDRVGAFELVKRGIALEALGQKSSDGWLQNVAGQLALWSGQREDSVEYHTQAVEAARSSGNVACEIISLTLAPFAIARLGDMEKASKWAEAGKLVGETVTQPSLVAYAHHGLAVVESYRDIGIAIKEYQLSRDWAVLGGNMQSARRLIGQIANLKVRGAEPQEVVAIYIDSLMQLPEHGEAIHGWSVMISLLEPLSQLEDDERVAVLSGALESSPIRTGEISRSAIEASKSRLGDEVFAAAQRRGAELDLPKLRQYILGEAKYRH